MKEIEIIIPYNNMHKHLTINMTNYHMEDNTLCFNVSIESIMHKYIGNIFKSYYSNTNGHMKPKCDIQFDMNMYLMNKDKSFRNINVFKNCIIRSIENGNIKSKSKIVLEYENIIAISNSPNKREICEAINIYNKLRRLNNINYFLDI